MFAYLCIFKSPRLYLSDVCFFGSMPTAEGCQGGWHRTLSSVISQHKRGTLLATGASVKKKIAYAPDTKVSGKGKIFLFFSLFLFFLAFFQHFIC